MSEMEKALTVGQMAEMGDDAKQFLYGVMAGLTAKQERRESRVGEREGAASGGAGDVPSEEKAG